MGTILFILRKRFGETKIFILSVEMIDELMKYLSFRDKKTLRLVSRSMYDLVTPHDKRFYTWNIDLNRGRPVKLGGIFDRCPDAKLHITLHKSESVMAKFMDSYTHDLTKVKIDFYFINFFPARGGVGHLLNGIS